ncbi:MAG: GxxExxY protein [Candidatus Omnitrophota bacterium]
MNNLKSLSSQIKTLAEEVRKHLGCGFDEEIFQNALAIEFRKHKIEYLKEVNIEIFYKGESVGVDRPDFIITRIGGFRKPVILETKVSDKISDNHRMQLRSYCTSLPRNNNPVLKGFAGGMLLSFPSCDIDSCAATKMFVVDSRFRVIVDEQAEEDKKGKKKKK